MSKKYDYPPAPPYPPLTPILHPSPIALRSTPEKGRGVYATEAIHAGTVVDISPVLLFSEEEYAAGVDRSVLRGYVFTWRGKERGMALALGLGSLFNHSETPNMSFELNVEDYTITYRAFREIEAGEELCIFYGHNVQFTGAEEGNAGEEDDKDEEPLGGLERVAAIVPGKKEEEIVPFEELDWTKVTRRTDPEKQELELMSCYCLTVPARLTPAVFAFVRRLVPNYEALNHLKKVKPLDDTEPGRRSAETPIRVLLFATESAPEGLEEALQSDAQLSGFALSEVDVSRHTARTDEQASAWSKVWPVQIVHIREGPRATVRAHGWSRDRIRWVRRVAETMWRTALRGSNSPSSPTVCVVTDSFDSDLHTGDRLPATLVTSTDTRHSSDGHALTHACMNAIRAVSEMDQRSENSSRAPYLSQADLTTLSAAVVEPYYLSGLSVFLTHEPCLMCAMALVHSRVKTVYYIKSSPRSGGLGSVYVLHEDDSLNHKFDVWSWTPKHESSMGQGLDIEGDA